MSISKSCIPKTREIVRNRPKMGYMISKSLNVHKYIYQLSAVKFRLIAYTEFIRRIRKDLTPVVKTINGNLTA